MRRSILLLFTLLLAMVLGAAPPDPKIPQGENLDLPSGWKVRLDKPDDSVVIGSDKETADIWFVNMTPGWHITTGPAAILYHPESRASGEVGIDAVIHLFPPEGKHIEAFGIFFGGSDLEKKGQSYDYFLIRNTGEFLVKRRSGTDTSTVQGWAKSDAIVRQSGEKSAKNRLSVEAGKQEIRFLINGTTVATLPRADVRIDGIAGLRINHHVNVHIEDFSIRPLKN